MRLLTDEQITVAQCKGHEEYCKAVEKDPGNQELLGQEFVGRAIADAEHKETLKAVKEAINDYTHNKISFERLAELLEINTYELDVAFREHSEMPSDIYKAVGEKLKHIMDDPFAEEWEKINYVTELIESLSRGEMPEEGKWPSMR